MCYSPVFRLRLEDGRHVWMDWHDYCGPAFYRDRYFRREIENWYDDPQICNALGWFIGRGKVA
jgi:hypothetical protein